MSSNTSRHHAREVALQILYRYDGGATTAPPPETSATQLPPQTPQQTIEELNKHFEHFEVPMELRAFVADLVAGTLREISSLDALLENQTAHWKIARMSVVDRNLLRMASYELRRYPDTPVSVVIDEAIELAKQFGTAESPAFINGVLDALKGTLRPA